MSKDNEFYDDNNVLESYSAHRKRPDNPNDALERPLFLDLVGDLRGLDITDLGCGDGLFGKEALDSGARSYKGIEASEAMIDIAKRVLANTRSEVYHQRIEDWQPESETADLVTSRLSLNYIEHLAPVFSQAYKTLRSKGRMIISVEHPVITSNFSNLEKGQRTSWLVDNYFKSGARVHTWLGKEITKYHHTLEEWLGLFKGAGFQIEEIRESQPDKANFHSVQEYERRLRIPLFLFVSARKP